MKNFFDKLYSNVGRKLCMLAKIMAVVEIISGIVLMLLAVVSSDGLVLLIVAASVVVCVISTWPLYAFGQMVDDVHSIRNARAAAPGRAAAPEQDFYDLPEL